MAKRRSKLEVVCRTLCKQFGGDDPDERVDYGNGWRWYDYHIEARAVLRALKRAGH